MDKFLEGFAVGAGLIAVFLAAHWLGLIQVAVTAK